MRRKVLPERKVIRLPEQPSLLAEVSHDEAKMRERSPSGDTQTYPVL